MVLPESPTAMISAVLGAAMQLSVLVMFDGVRSQLKPPSSVLARWPRVPTINPVESDRKRTSLMSEKVGTSTLSHWAPPLRVLLKVPLSPQIQPCWSLTKWTDQRVRIVLEFCGAQERPPSADFRTSPPCPTIQPTRALTK